jgi:aspartate aminotransferase
MVLLTNPNIDEIQMPENLALAMKVMDFRAQCAEIGCTYDYAHFAFGGSPFPVPTAMQDALKQHADAGTYLPAVGIEPLRKQISAFWQEHFELDVDPNRIVVMPGSKQAIMQVLMLMQGPVLLPQPSWVGYLPIAQLLGKEIIEVPTTADDGYRVTADGLASVAEELGARQSILILNSPNNPTGAVYSPSELESIAGVCREHGIVVISDEIYSMITYERSGFTSMAKIYPEGTFVTTGVSKFAGAGGYRLGFAILPTESTEAQVMNFAKVGAATYTNAAAPIQHAAIAAFSLDDEMTTYIEAQRNLHRIMTTDLSRRFVELEGVEATAPAGSFYFFADFEGLRQKLRSLGVNTGMELEHLLYGHPHHIAMVAGESLVMPPESLTFRVASVDYDGAAAMAAYLDASPRSADEERAFVETHAPRLILGVERLRRWIDSL